MHGALRTPLFLTKCLLDTTSLTAKELSCLSGGAKSLASKALLRRGTSATVLLVEVVVANKT